MVLDFQQPSNIPDTNITLQPQANLNDGMIPSNGSDATDSELNVWSGANPVITSSCSQQISGYQDQEIQDRIRAVEREAAKLKDNYLVSGDIIPRGQFSHFLDTQWRVPPI